MAITGVGGKIMKKFSIFGVPTESAALMGLYAEVGKIFCGTKCHDALEPSKPKFTWDKATDIMKGIGVDIGTVHVMKVLD